MIEDRGDMHHRFPKDYLMKNEINNKQMYNQIANFGISQTEINIKISNKSPNEYMGQLVEQCKGQEDVYGLISSMEDLNKNLVKNAV